MPTPVEFRRSTKAMPLCILSFAKVTEILEKQNSLSENFTGSSEEIDIRPTDYVSRFGCPSDIGFLPPPSIPENSAEIGKTHEINSAEIGKTHEINLAEIGKTYEINLAETGKTNEINSAEIGKTHEINLAEIGKTNEINLAEIDKTYKINLAEIGKTHEINLAEIGKYIILYCKSTNMGKDTIFFKRKMYERMLKWKNERNGDSALLIQGAR